MKTDQDPIVDIAPDFVRIDVGRSFPPARLVPTSDAGYLLLAARIDRLPMFLPNTRTKRTLIAQIHDLLASLEDDDRVTDTVVLDGIVRPVARSEILKHRPEVPVARFDLALLVETTSVETAAEVEGGDTWRHLNRIIEAASRGPIYGLRASNVRRMGAVDHHRQGVFLINYFFAERTDLNLAAWQYTAGWFGDQTGLDNSTVLLPDATTEPRYRLVNHARWDRLRDVLPDLAFNKTFRTYVLAHFAANGVAPMPVLYRLAPRGATGRDDGGAHRAAGNVA